MNYKIKKEKIDEFLISAKDLERIFDERIVELASVEGLGVKADRHAFILYRNELWDLVKSIKDNLEIIKETKKPK